METETTHYIYKEYSSFLKQYFTTKVQKISVDAGCTCPNRDGTVGRGGCTYCNNQTFRPDYCAEENSVALQLETGKAFFARKYPTMKYLAYFQAYTNTYGDQQKLKQQYLDALAVEDVVGLVVGTRPDCMPDDLLDFFAELSETRFVCIEYGIESTSDRILRQINRGHDYACAVDAVRRTAARHIPVSAHIILGLPGETVEEQLSQPALLNELPLDVLKLHQLQIVRGTVMAQNYAEHPEQFHLFTPQEYAERVSDYLERLRPDITLERFTSQSPSGLLIAPDWGMKNFEFVELLKRTMRQRNAWQGKLLP